MRIQALATDYDGTIAQEGVVSEATIAALREVRTSGRRLVLVTGRQLDDLMDVMPELTLFDRIVAENGAVLYDPTRQQETLLAEPPPPSFLSRLRGGGVPIAAGRVIVATGEPHEHEVLRAIRDEGLEWELIFNKGSVMALPSGVNKATGLGRALEELQLTPHNTAAIGDAENDHSFLRICEVAIAVGNAIPALKRRADLVMRAANGRGVAEFIRRYLIDDLAGAPQVFRRYSVELGTTSAGASFRFPVYGGNILILGSSGTGKSTLAGVLVERLAEQGYQTCIIDPEGDYGALDPLIVVGSAQARPALPEIEVALERAPSGVIVNLVSLSLAEKRRFSSELLAAVLAVRTSHGRPRWILVDEAHHLLPAEGSPGSDSLPPGVEGVCMVTVRAGLLARSALESVTHLFIVGADADEQIRGFADARALVPPAGGVDLELLEGEALSVAAEEGRLGRPRRFRIAPRRTEHQRHVRKYARGDLGSDRSFYFRGPDRRLNLRAYNVHAFAEMARGVDEATWDYHLKRGDIASWFREAIKDPELARSIEHVAAAADSRTPSQTRDEILHQVEQRYTPAE